MINESTVVDFVRAVNRPLVTTEEVRAGGGGEVSSVADRTEAPPMVFPTPASVSVNESENPHQLNAPRDTDTHQRWMSSGK